MKAVLIIGSLCRSTGMESILKTRELDHEILYESRFYVRRALYNFAVRKWKCRFEIRHRTGSLLVTCDKIAFVGKGVSSQMKDSYVLKDIN